MPYRIGRSTNLASKTILASLFYEPSTRTRLSFESAMLRLGGANITSADPAVSSAAKGESLADTIRVISNYADIIVIRHPRDGAARLAAEYSPIPVINGGDGSHEHPTQTLCDLFTLRSKKKSLQEHEDRDFRRSQRQPHHPFLRLRSGALRRDDRSPARARHGTAGARRSPAARGISLPHGVEGSQPGAWRSIDALYVTADQPHQLSLIPEPEVDYGLVVQKKTDAVYVTRFQKERWTEKDQPYPKIDAKFLGEAKYSDASVMHPLPRVNELDASFDTDRRAVYFQQAAYGVPIRMALISLLLHLHKNKSLHQFNGGFAKPDHPVYVQPIGTGIQCGNANCITDDPAERQYAANKFYVVEDNSQRHASCAAPIARTMSMKEAAAQFVAADTARQTFSPGLDGAGARARRKAQALGHISAATPTQLAAGLRRGMTAKRPGGLARARSTMDLTELGKLPCHAQARSPAVACLPPNTPPPSPSAICAARSRSASC